MAEVSAISWTDSTFNPWSTPKLLAASQFSLITNTVRLKVPKFMATMAKRLTVFDIEGHFRVKRQRHLMMCSKISSPLISTINAAKLIARKNCQPPPRVFRVTTQAQISLTFPVFISIVVSTAWCSLFRDRTDFGSGFGGMLFAQTIRRTAFRRLAHLAPGFGAHLGAFSHG